MTRWLVVALGGLLVVVLAIWSDREWRAREQQRREAVMEAVDDPAFLEEVRQAIEMRRAAREVLRSRDDENSGS